MNFSRRCSQNNHGAINLRFNTPTDQCNSKGKRIWTPLGCIYQDLDTLEISSGETSPKWILDLFYYAFLSLRVVESSRSASKR